MRRLTPVPATPARRSTLGALGGALACAALLVSCKDSKEPVAPTNLPSQPEFTVSSGSASTLLGRANFSRSNGRAVEIRRSTGNWTIDMKTKPSLDVAVQSITFQPGGQSGWHSHPGPVFIQVVSGTMTFYESDDPTCTPEVRTAGQGYLDLGEHAHIARNETGLPATNVVTYFAPPGAPLRIDQPRPGNCPF